MAKSRVNPGDTVELGLSHNVRIDGDQSWISYKVQGTVQEGETDEGVHNRLNSYLQEKLEQLIMETVAKVNEMSGK